MSLEASKRLFKAFLKRVELQTLSEFRETKTDIVRHSDCRGRDGKLCDSKYRTIRDYWYASAPRTGRLARQASVFSRGYLSCFAPRVFAGNSPPEWPPATARAAAASPPRSCASWCNSSVITPTSSRSAPASENSTRRRLTGHASSRGSRFTAKFTQVRRERDPRHPEPPRFRKAPPELLPHGEARLVPAATQQLRLP